MSKIISTPLEPYPTGKQQPVLSSSCLSELRNNMRNITPLVAYLPGKQPPGISSSCLSELTSGGPYHAVAGTAAPTIQQAASTGTSSPTTASGFNVVNNLANPFYAFTSAPLAGSTTPNPNMASNLEYMANPVGQLTSGWVNPVTPNPNLEYMSSTIEPSTSGWVNPATTNTYISGTRKMQGVVNNTQHLPFIQSEPASTRKI